MAERADGNGRSRKKRKARSPWVRRIKIIAGVLTLVFLIASVAGLGYFMVERNKARSEIQKFEDLAAELQVKPSVIVAADGTLLYQTSGELREYAPLSEIPKLVQDAMIAAEDRRFRDREAGVDVVALARTAFVDVRGGALKQGASTLEMQLAKMVSENSDKTFRRKIHDMALAMELTDSMDKNRILELYLNKVYFGNHAYGIKAAADVYFGKPLDKLTPAEAAFLVRLVRRPSSWNNLLQKENLDKAIENRNFVLQIMRSEGMINQDQYQEAVKEVPHLNKKPPHGSDRTLRAPYFVAHVLAEVHRQFPDIRLSDGGYRIETTLDAGMQALAEKSVAETVERNRKNKVTTAAFVLMNTEGEILAEVGGADFDKNQYNAIYQGRRQPGSSFKPFVYATALNDGAVHVDDTLPNLGPYTFPAPPGGRAWTVHNSNGKYSPSVSLRTAFALSMNVPAAHVIDKVGPAEVVRTAHEAFGFVSTLQPVLPLVLGSDAVNPLEVAQGLSVFALRGDRATPFVIKRVVGRDGEVIQEFGPRIVRNVFNPDVCDQIDSLMRGVVQFGTGYKAIVVPNARGKTGTTNDNRDAWFIGYTDGLIGVGWIANERPRKNGPPRYDPMGHSVYGGTVTVEFWASVMKSAHDKYGEKYAVAHHDEKKGAAEAPPLPKDMAPLDSTDEPQMGPTSDDAGAGGAAPPDDTQPKDQNPPDGTDAVPVAVAADPTPSATPAKPPKPVETKRPETPDASQYVEVEVCVETGMRASVYCPETITKRFKKGTEPKKVCTLHTG